MSNLKEDLEDILKGISLTGAAQPEIADVKQNIGGNLIHILNTSAGLPRLHTNVISRFSLILSQPKSLSALTPFEIHCALCRKVITYPAWYYHVRYTVNNFHYFICFDAKSSDKPNCKCYRKG